MSKTDRKEAIEYAKFRLECHTKGDGEYTDYGEFLVAAIEALQEPERKKGHWIILSSNEDSTVCKCSVCGEDFVFYEGEYFPNYCGDCGSDMRGEEG